LINKIRLFFSRRHTIRTHFWQTTANYTQQIGGLALGIVLARILAPADFGQFAFASALALLCLMPLNWSLAVSLLATRCRDEALVRHAWNLAGWTFLAKLAVVLSLVVWFVAKGEPRMGLLVVLIGLPACSWEFINLLRAEVESEGNFKPHIFSALATVGFVLIINVPLALAGWGALALAAGGIPLAISQWFIYRRATTLDLHRRPGFTSVHRNYFHEGIWQWLSSMTDQALGRLDKLFLGHWAGGAALGNYNRAFGYAPLSHLALSSLYTNPTIAALGLKSARRDKLALLGKSAALAGAAGLANGAFWWWFSDPVVVWVFGPQWESAIPVFQAMSGLALCYLLFYLPATVLYHKRWFKAIGLARLAAVAVFCLLCTHAGERLDAVTVAVFLQVVMVACGLMLSLCAWAALREDT
jgi:lipopolysaccharide exporter